MSRWRWTVGAPNAVGAVRRRARSAPGASLSGIVAGNLRLLTKDAVRRMR